MRLRTLLMGMVALAAVSALAQETAVALNPGAIEVRGFTTARGFVRVSCRVASFLPSQPALQAVRLTALPSGTSLVTLVSACAPASVSDTAFDTSGAVLQAPLGEDALSAQAPPVAPGDNRIRIEYVLLPEAGEPFTLRVGEIQFASLAAFHFTFTPSLDDKVAPEGCAFCGGDRCGCQRCPEVYVCCPSCQLSCTGPEC